MGRALNNVNKGKGTRYIAVRSRLLVLKACQLRFSGPANTLKTH